MYDCSDLEIDYRTLTAPQLVGLCCLDCCTFSEVCLFFHIQLNPFRSFETRWFFRKHLKHIVTAEHARGIARDSMNHVRREQLLLRRSDSGPFSTRLDTGIQTVRRRHPNIQPNMVRRVDIAPYPITPVGVQSMVVSKDELGPSTSTTTTLHHLEHDEEHAPRTVIGTIVEDPEPNTAIATDGEFGGFPGPREIASTMIRRICPSLHKKLQRTVTMPLSETLIPSDANIVPPPTSPSKRVPYISFKAIVGRNSAFYGLSEANIEELGGVEYRALTALLWIVPAVSGNLLPLNLLQSQRFAM